MSNVNTNITEGMLFTDFYQLTMAQLYYRTGIHEKQAQFEYFFRSYPDYGEHKAGYCINAGLETFLDWSEQLALSDDALSYLRHHNSSSNKPLFTDDFLSWLKEEVNIYRVSMQAIPEGRVVHPNIPLVVVRGPMAVAQILESSLLNHLNYQTMIATKACRLKEACNRGLLIDFGMRRAHDRAANAGARAALIGGVDFTSNTGISYTLGFPPKGTHAHSMVQAFMALGEGELGAFRAYAGLYPDDCLLLVDTVDTLHSGIPNAITVFNELKRKGHEPVGIRLDSGDLAFLSIQAALMLDKAGFDKAAIVLSNQLDEMVIWQIISQIRGEAPRYGMDPDRLIKRLVYGVGTRLITSSGASALDGIYKLTAIEKDNKMTATIKISENASKIINPGSKKVWRIYDRRDKAVADYLTLEEEDPLDKPGLVLHHPVKSDVKRVMQQKDITHIENLLEDILQNGKRKSTALSIDEMRKNRETDLERLDPGIKRIINSHIYHISLSEKLWELKQELLETIYSEIDR